MNYMKNIPIEINEQGHKDVTSPEGKSFLFSSVKVHGIDCVVSNRYFSIFRYLLHCTGDKINRPDGEHLEFIFEYE